MPATASKLAKEELRAILVLGIIGTLIGARGFLDISLGFGIHVSDFTNWLLVYWSGYLFLMVVGISDDVIKPQLARRCADAAPACFRAGITLTLTLILVIGTALVIGYLKPSLLSGPGNVGIVIAVVLACIPPFFLIGKWIGKEPSSLRDSGNFVKKRHRKK